MKIQDIIIENKAGVRESRLNELAPGGGEGNGPFDYGPAIIQIGQDFAEFYDDEGVDADARAIIKVGNTFMSAGMKAGIQAFYAMDTQVRDHVAEQLMDQGFNVRQDIYEPYDQQFTAAEAARGIETILALLKEFAKTVEEPEDRKTVAGIYKAFQQGMEPGFVALRNAFEFDIDADFYDFARDRGIDLDQVAARAGFDTDSLHEGKQGVTEAKFTSQFKTKQEAVQYAKEKVKIFRDPEDGIEVWAMPDSGFNVVHTMNYSGRESVMALGGRKLGTVGPRWSGVAEGEITRTATGLIHRGTKGYGADYEPDYGTDLALSKQKHHADLNRVNKSKLRSLEKSMGIDFKNDTQDVQGDIGPSEQEMNQSISDLVKDALGTRPNGQWMQRWQDSTEKQKRDLYNRLVKQLEQE